MFSKIESLESSSDTFNCNFATSIFALSRSDKASCNTFQNRDKKISTTRSIIINVKKCFDYGMMLKQILTLEKKPAKDIHFWLSSTKKSKYFFVSTSSLFKGEKLIVSGGESWVLPSAKHNFKESNSADKVIKSVFLFRLLLLVLGPKDAFNSPLGSELYDKENSDTKGNLGWLPYTCIVH